MEGVRNNRKAIYQKMQIVASDPEILAFYVQEVEDWGYDQLFKLDLT